MNQVEFIPLPEQEGVLVALTKPDGEVGLQHINQKDWERIQYLFGPKESNDY